MKTVGIIGGLGPETTAKFYLEVIRLCLDKDQSHRPPILIWSVPLPYQIEKEAIIQAKGEERNIPYLIEAAKKLEKSGADFLVMPCNTLHIFIEEIRKAVSIPVLSIIEETVNFLKNKNVKRVGLLATSITINHNLYSQKLNSNGIKEIIPDQKEQINLNQIIHRIVMNRYSDKDKKTLDDIIDNFSKKGLKTVVLACTDLQILTSQCSGIEIYDTMKILAEATAQKIIS